MTAVTRLVRLNAAFVKLADTLVADFDVVDMLQWLVEECTEMLDTQAGGIMLVDPAGALQLVASTSEEAELVEAFQIAGGDGPCLDCFRSGEPVTIADLEIDGGRWPQFQRLALDLGFRSVHATPLRLRGTTIGTMNLFSLHPGALALEDIAIAQALADVATIGILQERSIRNAQLLSEQLQRALDSRILIEQAKGVLAASLGTSMHEAFALLRGYSRSENIPLRRVAEEVVSRQLDLRLLAQ